MKNKKLKNQDDHHLLIGFIPSTHKMIICFAIASEEDYEDLDLQIKAFKSHLNCVEEITKLACVASFYDDGIILNGSFIHDATNKVLMTKVISELPQLLIDYINIRELVIEIIKEVIPM